MIELLARVHDCADDGIDDVLHPGCVPRHHAGLASAVDKGIAVVFDERIGDGGCVGCITFDSGDLGQDGSWKQLFEFALGTDVNHHLVLMEQEGGDNSRAQIASGPKQKHLHVDLAAGKE